MGMGAINTPYHVVKQTQKVLRLARYRYILFEAFMRGEEGSRRGGEG
jgi:hypothetical protein